MHSLTSSLGVEVSFDEEWRFPNDAPAYKIVRRANLEADKPENLPAARQKIQGAMTRPTFDQAEEWLATLQAACARRTDSEAMGALGLTLYASTLTMFPADIAKAVCVKMALRKTNGPNWFPSLSEINQECEKMATARTALAVAAGVR